MPSTTVVLSDETLALIKAALHDQERQLELLNRGFPVNEPSTYADSIYAAREEIQAALVELRNGTPFTTTKAPHPEPPAFQLTHRELLNCSSGLQSHIITLKDLLAWEISEKRDEQAARIAAIKEGYEDTLLAVNKAIPTAPLERQDPS